MCQKLFLHASAALGPGCDFFVGLLNYLAYMSQNKYPLMTQNGVMFEAANRCTFIQFDDILAGFLLGPVNLYAM
jgi:hypothetical protein